MTTELQTDGAPSTPAEGTQQAADTQATAPATQADPATDAAPAAPFEYQAPEGVELDQDALGEFKALVHEEKLPAETAKKLADIAVKMAQKQADSHRTLVEGWAESVKADKEIGGDKLPQTLAVAKKALDLAPPGMKDLLNSTGMGNHPDVVRWAYAIGQKLSEDTFVKSGAPAAGERSLEKRLFPNMN